MSSDHPEKRAQVETEAADWLARRFAGLDAQEQTGFERWLASDTTHAAVFQELEQTWQLLDRAREIPHSPEPDPDALSPLQTGRRARFWVAIPLAAAAIIVAGIFFQQRTSERDAAYTTLAKTEVGEQKLVVLRDGSTGRLNTNTQIEVDFSATERRVRLVRGEAFFAVAKNPNRPFFVDVAGVAVRAVGTAFNVRLRETAVDVIVTEGRVRVDDSDGRSLLPPSASQTAPQLVAGQQVVVPISATSMDRRSPVAPTTTPIEIKRALAWQEQRLEFLATPLGEIVAEFNRYNRTKLVIADDSLTQQRFGGRFKADEPETFARQLQSRFRVIVEHRPEEIVLRAGP